MNSSTDRIERNILLKAPRSRVWRALSNAEEFGDWFGAALKGKTFAAGQRVQGQITYPGYEHLVFDVVIERMEPERLLSFRWHPYPVKPVDYFERTDHAGRIRTEGSRGWHIAERRRIRLRPCPGVASSGGVSRE